MGEWARGAGAGEEVGGVIATADPKLFVDCCLYPQRREKKES